MAGIFHTEETGWVPEVSITDFKQVSKFPEILWGLSMCNQCVPGSLFSACISEPGNKALPMSSLLVIHWFTSPEETSPLMQWMGSAPSVYNYQLIVVSILRSRALQVIDMQMCMNHQWATSPSKRQAWMLCKVTHSTRCASTNTRPHQLCWGDRETKTAISCPKCSQVAGLIMQYACIHTHVHEHTHTQTYMASPVCVSIWLIQAW